jgi:hypothetical protein
MRVRRSQVWPFRSAWGVRCEIDKNSSTTENTQSLWNSCIKNISRIYAVALQQWIRSTGMSEAKLPIFFWRCSLVVRGSTAFCDVWLQLLNGRDSTEMFLASGCLLPQYAESEECWSLRPRFVFHAFKATSPVSGQSANWWPFNTELCRQSMPAFWSQINSYHI